MTEHQQGRRRGRARVWLALSALAVILALLIAPPFISVRRYQNRITQVIAASVGRPVRLSSVELRALPTPSFVIADLTVEEDPAYGAEPVLHANTVTASIRLMPLWLRGRLEISRISVDEASLNLVRTSAGQWNIDSFFRIAASRAQTGAEGRSAMPFPYLEATDSRVNIKNGVEKLPYSLVNADLSFWQESPGEWRVRLKGQPARTDVSLDLADTGIVRLEGRMRRAAQLSQVPIHLDVAWRDAQLGQLSRLLLGSDEGWRGALEGEIHMDGNADAAQVTTRLSASGVHRAEFAPASPIDFDVNCSLVYHYSDRGLEKLLCDSPIGNGRARLTGELPGRARELPAPGPDQHASPRLTVELDRVPAQVALDILRTLRNGIDPSLQASGAISGRMDYAPVVLAAAAAPPRVRATGKATRTHAPPPGPLAGTINIAGFRLSGDTLSKPILPQKVTVESAPGEPAALVATIALPAGAPAALNVTARLALNGYQMEIRGGAALARLRELAQVAGIADASLLGSLDGPPVTLDVYASGPWMRAAAALPVTGSGSAADPAPAPVLVRGPSDDIGGTVTMHSAAWKTSFLANPVELSSAILRFDRSGLHWDPVTFTYGPVRGAATLQVPKSCPTAGTCPPRFTVDFGSLDAATLEAAILGARKQGTLLSSLLSRLTPGSSPGWPDLEGSVRAQALVLGPVTLINAQALLHIQAGGTELRSLDAGLLGGRIHLEGTVQPGEKPDYKLKGQFEQLNATDLGRLLGMTWSGSPIGGTGEVELVGFTDSELAESARGAVHFDWRHGAIAEKGDVEIPAALARFDQWSADAAIADGAITLKHNQVQRGARKVAVEGAAMFGNPPQVTFGQQQDARAANSRAKP